jgi:hypothetical protein
LTRLEPDSETLYRRVESLAEKDDGVLDDSTLDKLYLTKIELVHRRRSGKPPLPVGAAVKSRRGNGIIDRLYEHRPMTYAIKMDDDAQAQPPTNRRTLLYFDDVEAA